MVYLHAVLALLLLQSSSAQEAPASIAGVVVEAGTGRPISDAKVSLAIPPGLRSVTTDGNGQFAFPGVQPGTLPNVFAGAVGYVARIYRGPALPTDSKLEPNQKVTGVRIELSPTGTILGRIFDRNGDPVSNVEVQALQSEYRHGKKSLRIVESRPTDDLGNYRLFWLEPGPYFIRIVQSDSIATSVRSAGNLPSGLINSLLGRTNSFPSEISSGKQIRITQNVDSPRVVHLTAPEGEISHEATIPLYYPGTTRPDQAVPVVVRSGMTTGGIDFPMVPTPVFRVAGYIGGNSADGLATSVRLIPAGSSGVNDLALDNVALPGEVSSNQEFEIRGVPPGSYILVTNQNVDAMSWSGKLPVEVHQSDITGLSVNLTPDVRVAGRFFINGEIFNSQAGTVSGDVQLRSDVSETDDVIGTVSGDTVTFEFVPPGTYTVSAENLKIKTERNQELPAYLSSVRLGSRDVLHDGLDVSGSSKETLEIAIRTDVARVTGRVIDSSGRPFPGAFVVLVPSLRDEHYRYTSTGSGPSGEFLFENVVPGEYTVIAWENINSSTWQNPEVIRSYERFGKSIPVVSGENRLKEVLVITGDSN